MVACKSQKEDRQTMLETSNNKNVVSILVDDLGWKDLGCYGSTFCY